MSETLRRFALPLKISKHLFPLFWISRCPHILGMATQVLQKVWIFCVSGSMRGSRHCFQVLGPIVAALSVDVMHDFTAAKFASIRRLPVQSMFGNVATSICKAMLRKIYKPVSVLGQLAATLPTGSSPSFLAVAMEKINWLSSNMASFSGCRFCNSSASAAAAFTDSENVSIQPFALFDPCGLLFCADGLLKQAAIVVRYELPLLSSYIAKDWICFFRNWRYLTTTTFARHHPSIITNQWTVLVHVEMSI